MLRYPTVSGTFYASRISALEKQINSFFGAVDVDLNANSAETITKTKAKEKAAVTKQKTIGIIAPHAGYAYSGHTAAKAYASIASISKDCLKKFIILGPNHTGIGEPVSIWNRGAWLTPLGEAKIDESLADKILLKSAIAKTDESAHLSEHSIEVQIPFLQFLFGNTFSFVPICMANQSIEAAIDIAKAILSLKAGDRFDFTIIASSDFTHYESRKSVEAKDSEAIKAIQSLDAARFYRTLEENDISACGFGPVAVLMIVTKALGGKIVKVAHSDSGDAGGDTENVVGYAALKAEQAGE